MRSLIPGKTIWQKFMLFLGVLLFVIPVLCGLVGILLPAAGYFPALGFNHISTEPARLFFETPGVGQASWLTLKIGMIATALSLLSCFIVLIGVMHSPGLPILSRWLGALVAVPHSSIAIGLVFLLSPSGWLIRLLSPGFTGFHQPPDWSLIPDPHGWALVFGLMAKETPFLLMVSLAAIATQPVSQLERIGNSLGYGRISSWILLILPLVYRQIRLPILAVLVFGLSVVDMALLLAPTLPPPLAVLVLHGFIDANLAARLPASFGAVIQIGIVMCGLSIWMVFEALCNTSLKYWQCNGWRLRHADKYLPLVSGLALLPIIAATAGLTAALLWSVAGNWFFPEALPMRLHLIHWQDYPSYLPLIRNSFWLATSASFVAIVAVLASSYSASASTLQSRWLLCGIFLPLFVPQVSFLLGMQISLSSIKLDGNWLALLWAHVIFILPYIWLILMPAKHALDRRLDSIAATLGASPWQRFWQLHIPLMAYPLGTAFFIGVSVSIALYLPTLFVGAGRINTITVEAVTLAAGGSRGPAGVATILQIAIPLVTFSLIHTALRWRFSKFSDMRSGDLQ